MEGSSHISGMRDDTAPARNEHHGMSMNTEEMNRGEVHGAHQSGRHGARHERPGDGGEYGSRHPQSLLGRIGVVHCDCPSFPNGSHVWYPSSAFRLQARSWTLFALTTPVVFWCGWMFIFGAYQALRSRKLDMAVLIAVGVLAAYLASFYLTVIGSKDLFYEAAAMLVTFVLFGHWMEMKSRRGTSNALRALFDLVPAKARVHRDGKEIEIPTSEVVQGDLLVLRPGDRVPVDGEVTEGETAVDEALVTGESVPVEKKPGDKLIGGSVNGAGAVTYKATAVGEDATLSRIAKLVETAQNSKAPGQRLADKAAAYLVVLAVGAGIITFVAWRWGAGASFLTALTFSISAVVIACPDALGLATPTAVAVGTGLGAKHHILIKDAATLEGASRITAVVLDKTGTLTEGKPRVTDVAVAEGFSEDDALRSAWGGGTQFQSPTGGSDTQ